MITSAGPTEKAENARSLGYTDVIDLSKESLSDGVMRLTDGKGVDVALDSIGGDDHRRGAEVGRARRPGHPDGLPGGTGLTVNSLTLIWSALGAGGSTSIEGFNIYFQPPEAYAAAWGTVLPLLADGTVKPAIDRTYPLEEAAAATRHLIEDRPFGKVVLTM